MLLYDKNYVICDGCGKLFITKKRLLVHYKDNHFEKPHACSFCGKRFKKSKKGLLKEHELNHQNIKEFPCAICSKRFKGKRFVMEHIRSVHFKSKILCELCGKSFPRPGYYKVHVKDVHANLGDDKLEQWLDRIGRIKPDYDDLQWICP